MKTKQNVLNNQMVFTGVSSTKVKLFVLVVIKKCIWNKTSVKKLLKKLNIANIMPTIPPVNPAKLANSSITISVKILPLNSVKNFNRLLVVKSVKMVTNR